MVSPVADPATVNFATLAASNPPTVTEKPVTFRAAVQAVVSGAVDVIATPEPSVFFTDFTDAVVAAVAP